MPALAGLALVLAFAAQARGTTQSMVRVDMDNRADGTQVMSLDRAEIPAGTVTFEVHNASKDVVHEFLVVKTTTSAAALAMDQTGTRVDEKRLKGVKELGDLAAQQDGKLTMSLRPGHYVLFCNQPGHFAGGMRADLVVVTPR
jgi:uncharacterized cupredoxin-like copper-binding protein